MIYVDDISSIQIIYDLYDLCRSYIVQEEDLLLAQEEDLLVQEEDLVSSI